MGRRTGRVGICFRITMKSGKNGKAHEADRPVAEAATGSEPP